MHSNFNHQSAARCRRAWGRVATAVLFALAAASNWAANESEFVRVSPRDPRYFELTDGTPYVPIGLNLIAPDNKADNEAAGLAGFEAWCRKLSANGGNFVRVWLSSPFWDIEHQQSGVYDEAKLRRIQALFAMAHRHGIRLKLCLEHFRSLDPSYPQVWSQKLLHRTDRGGPAQDMDEFFRGERSRAQFKRKLAWLAQHLGETPDVFGWELWNEINAVRAKPTSYLPWTQTMLAELHRLFPRNLAMQSLGSFDRNDARDIYRQHTLMPGNEVAQVHRYLDLGAKLEVCRGPMDVLAADAVRELLAWNPGRPVLLAESGAVEPVHTGPFKLYERDTAGVILHDVLFAPFFSGAAGPGHCWHWSQYVDRNDLWHHFARFAAAVRDVDPPAEDFRPHQLTHSRLRIYALVGRRETLLWCREGRNTWQSELEARVPPETLAGLTVDVSAAVGKSDGTVARIYDPWRDRWSETTVTRGSVVLPPFSRSIVIRVPARRL